MTPLFWRLEQLQRDFHMQVSQCVFVMQITAVLWLGGALGAVAVALWPDPRWAELVPWLIAATALSDPMPWHGRQYPAATVAQQLNTAVYAGTPGDWGTWAALWGLYLLPIMGLLAWLRGGRPLLTERHIRGTELIRQTDLQKRLRKQGPGGVVVAGVRIPQAWHPYHFSICGATGSGKSLTMQDMLYQITTAGETCVVVDPDGEFTRKFYTPERGDILLNPFDARWPGWNLWAECQTPASMDALVNALFPLPPGMKDEAKYYHEQARVQVTKLLRAHWGCPPWELATQAESTVPKAILSTVQNALFPFRHLRAGPQPWSARQWAEQRTGWIFFTWQEIQREAVLPLVSLWLEALTAWLLSHALESPETTWIVIDELAVLQAQTSLQELLTRGRKRGLAVVLGYQDVMRLIAIYGKETVATMLDQPTTRLMLRTNNAETQRWNEADIGWREVERLTEVETAGSTQGRDAVTISYPRKGEATVLGSELGMLPIRQGYLKVTGVGVARVAVPVVDLAVKQPAFIEPQTEISTRVESRQERWPV